MTPEEILAAVPQQEPFRFIDEILEDDRRQVGLHLDQCIGCGLVVHDRKHTYGIAFIKTLKREEIYANDYQDLDHLRANIKDFVERYYSRCRLHSALGYRSPEDFERAAGTKAACAEATMSVFRHPEIYRSDGKGWATGKPAPRTIVSISLRPAIPRRVGLHQSPPPLHQPRTMLGEKRLWGEGKTIGRRVSLSQIVSAEGCTPIPCRQKWRHGTQECVRHKRKRPRIWRASDARKGKGPARRPPRSALRAEQ